MQEGYWKKTLTDGSSEFGYDSAIEKKIASWTNGRQDIVKVDLSNGSEAIQISSSSKPPSFWRQLDHYCFNPRTGKSSRLARELACSLDDNSRLMIQRDMGYVYRFTHFTLNKERGIEIPNDVSLLVCQIGIDGKVSYQWS